MEDTLREEKNQSIFQCIAGVLILVVMEDTLREFLKSLSKWQKKVLILVVMEDTLRAYLSI